MIRMCYNCQEREATGKVLGYDVCEECQYKAELPWYMREETP